MNDTRQDRLYELLPEVYRMRDAEQGEPLRALLRVIAEQVNLVEDDIHQLYENWFIETCEDWAVPYIGELVGYEPVHEAGEPSAINTRQGRQRNKILIPRREVANTIRYRRRKGTLALLELVAGDAAGWPARVVEFRNLLSRTQAINHQQPNQGKTVDLRQDAALDLLNTPFDPFAHTVDVRRINSHCSQGRYNIPSVGVFVWRLKSYSVNKSLACYSYNCEQRRKADNSLCFTFSALGNDTQLYMRPEPESDPTHIADEFNLPVPIRRRLLRDKTKLLYGHKKSLQIWDGENAVPLSQIVTADLSNWNFTPSQKELALNPVAVDPVLGRIVFPVGSILEENDVWCSYHYGFCMDIGGGEYERPLEQLKAAKKYEVNKKNKSDCTEKIYNSIGKALTQWQKDNENSVIEHAVIEITDSDEYAEEIDINFNTGQKSLQLRAGNGHRPVIRLWNTKRRHPNFLTVTGTEDSRLTLDGLLIVGCGMRIDVNLAELTIRHSTLVPGWEVGGNFKLRHPEWSDAAKPSLKISCPDISVKIDHSIVGSIQVVPPRFDKNKQTAKQASMKKNQKCHGKISEEIRLDPIRICIHDSIVDATDPDTEAIGAPGCPVAYAVINVVRSTIIGQVHAHAVASGESSIFYGGMKVARSQVGRLRFCYVSDLYPETDRKEKSRMPKRYRCQPDLVKAAIQEEERCTTEPDVDAPGQKLKLEQKLKQEITRIRPRFNSLRYGTPTYCQLTDDCADEIKGGADDEAEMGVFHDLYQPQRMANLRVRLDEYLPARMDIGVIVSN